MVKQDIENQYDDDLTLGTDEYDDSYYTDADDLFEFSTNDESPISRLKSLVLSIDWEITDEVLLQFNEELIDLKGIWAGNSINLVYVQALEKLSKYIYQNKANSHPNAIKLLLTLYYNLEKIVSSEDLAETQKKEILLEDVKKFEALKRQISQKSKPAQDAPPARPQAAKVTKEGEPEDKLLTLKAIVLGIDWEITDQDLNDLRREVIRLEEQFADSRPKLILLQGIGTLGAYIKTKKSNAHADAFKVLHLFYESLEKIVKTPMSFEEEKAILFPAVGKFNDFKALLGPTISPEAIGREEDEEEDEEFEESGSGEIAPALADVSDEEIGFQAEEEARSLGLDSTEGVSSHLDNFFGESVPPPVADDSSEVSAKEKASAAGFDDAAVLPAIERDVALQGVDVEADDEEEDTDAYKSGVAALADAADDAVSEWKEVSDDAKGDVVLAMDDSNLAILASDAEIAKATDSLFPDAEVPSSGNEYGGIDREVALQGVNVETEADEDSDEASLPMDGEQVAPALVASEEESLFSARTLESSVAGDISEEIEGTLDDLFLDEKVPAFVALETAANENFIDEPSGEEALEETAVESVHVEAQPAVEETVGEVATENAEIPAIQEEEDLSLFFTGSDLEQSAEESAAVDSLFESLEPALVEENEKESVSAEIDEQMESFFVQEEHPEESSREIPASAADEVTVADEVAPALEEEVSPAEDEITEEITPVEEEISPAEEEISLFEAEDQLAEEDISINNVEISAAEEEVAPVEESPAVEELFSIKDTDFLVEEEISITEEISAEEENSPIEMEIAPGEENFPIEEEIVPPEEEGTVAEEISLLEEEASPAVEISPVAGEISSDIERLFDESLTAADSASPLSSDAEISTLAATTFPEKEAEEEEVVFQLVEAEAEPVPASTVAAAPEEPESAFIDEPELAFADEVTEDLSPAFEPVREEETVSFAAPPIGVGSEMPGDPLAGLRDCIESLGIELNDKIINGLFQEINDLRQKWSNRPLEKTFLQLLSTITQHIDRYRFEASSDAHNLLHSVFTALSARREEDMHYNQELLLMESLKVLEWQQGMLTRQAQKGSQLMFATPVRTEEDEVGNVVDAKQDFDQLLQEYQETEEVSPVADEPLEVQSGPQTNLGRESLAVELKQEIATLRMTLQQEIAELRSELKGK